MKTFYNLELRAIYLEYLECKKKKKKNGVKNVA